jgi:hypothetical protein
MVGQDGSTLAWSRGLTLSSLRLISGDIALDVLPFILLTNGMETLGTWGGVEGVSSDSTMTKSSSSSSERSTQDLPA